MVASFRFDCSGSVVALWAFFLIIIWVPAAISFCTVLRFSDWWLPILGNWLSVIRLCLRLHLHLIVCKVWACLFLRFKRSSTFKWLCGCSRLSHWNLRIIWRPVSFLLSSWWSLWLILWFSITSGLSLGNVVFTFFVTLAWIELLRLILEAAKNYTFIIFVQLSLSFLMLLLTDILNELIFFIFFSLIIFVQSKFTLFGTSCKYLWEETTG